MLNIKNTTLVKSFTAMPKKNQKVAGFSLLITAALLGFGGWAIFGSGTQEKTNESLPGVQSKVDKSKPLRQAPIDQDQTSEEYKRILKAQAEEDAKKNRNAGTSHITEANAVTWGDIDPPQKPKPKNNVVKVVHASYTSDQVKEMAKAKFEAMKAYRDAISKTDEANSGEVIRGTYVAAKTTNATSTDDELTSDELDGLVRSASYYPSATKGVQKSSTTEIPGFSPGDTLLATTKYAVNSDTTTTILAQVVNGPLVNADVPLTVKREGEYVVFETINISWNRYSSPFKAIAIDPGVVSTNAFSTYTDRHIFYRYGSLFLSAFAEGAGEMAKNANSTITVNGETVMEDNKVGTKEYMIAGAGKIGSKLGAIAEKNFDTPPTVHVDKGTQLALVVIEEAQIPWLPSPYVVKKVSNKAASSDMNLNNKNSSTQN